MSHTVLWEEYRQDYATLILNVPGALVALIKGTFGYPLSLKVAVVAIISAWAIWVNPGLR